jgi:hypothetical protein
LPINPIEGDHQHLYQAIDTVFKRLQPEESLDSDAAADIETIISGKAAYPWRLTRVAPTHKGESLWRRT